MYVPNVQLCVKQYRPEKFLQWQQHMNHIKLINTTNTVVKENVHIPDKMTQRK